MLTSMLTVSIMDKTERDKMREARLFVRGFILAGLLLGVALDGQAQASKEARPL